MSSGVYRIRHLESNQSYIGSSVNLSQRWKKHRAMLNSNTHHAPHLQNAWRKYGTSMFVFEILLYCDPENCVAYEQVAIDHFKPQYNICVKAYSPLGVKRSEETKRKMREAQASVPRKGVLLGSGPNRNQGDKNSQAKLSVSDVREIKTMLVDGYSEKDIAMKFGVHRSSITYIKHGKTWRNVQI